MRFDSLCTDEELRDTRIRLENTSEVLIGTKQQLTAVEGALEEEIAVRQAHQRSEEALHSVVAQWKEAANEYEHDVSGLFSKLGAYVSRVEWKA